jgi:peptidoglycan lytic transglycosylase D
MSRIQLVSSLMLAAAGCASVQRAPSPVSASARAPIPVKATARAATSSAAETRTATVADLDESDVADALERLEEAAEGSKDAAMDPRADHAWLRIEIARAIGGFGKDEPESAPVSFVREVARCTSWLTRPGPGRTWLERSLKRMDAYEATVRLIFEERDLPPLLDHLALVESGFRPYARSHAGAAGMWQFMPATARRYGLEIDKTVDERLDPVRATFAAREYLLDLLLEFGSGHDALLAVAAYNAGEGRIRAVLRRLDHYRDRSFWTLAERGLLPNETKMYVPMILAVSIISANRARFGFPGAQPAAAMSFDAPRPKVHASVHSVAERSARAAPKPLRYLVRPNNTATAIALAFGVPRRTIERAAGRGGKLHAGQILELPIEGWERASHRVVKGDSLERIAKKHGTSVRSLCVFNGLVTSRIIAGDLLAIYRRVQPLGMKHKAARTRES